MLTPDVTDKNVADRRRKEVIRLMRLTPTVTTKDRPLFIPDHSSQLEEVVVAPDVEVVGVTDKGHHVGLYLPNVGCCQTLLKHVGELVAVYFKSVEFFYPHL